MSGKFALIIGNTEYTDPGLAQLTAPGRDAEDFARVLKDTEIGAFDDVVTLLNQPEYVVREAIDDFFNQKMPDDLLVLYFSGHGVRDELGALYLAVKNTTRTKLRATGIKSDYIREAMDQSRSRRQVLVLDCCNSGAFAQGTKAEIGGSVGTKSAFEGGYGRVILTASDSTQFAWEGDKVIGQTDNSLFTHYLVEGLEGEADLDGDGRITVDELYDYTFAKVKLATPKQTPSKFSTKQQGEVVLRHNIRVEDIKPVALPPEIIDEAEDTRPYVREAAVQKLDKILKGRNLGLARTAREMLGRIAADDDSRKVSQAALSVLESHRLIEEKAEAEHKAREEADRLAALKEEEEQLLREKEEAERKAKEEAKKLARAKAEREAAERETARLKAERKAAELAAQEAAEKAAKEKVEREAAEREAVQKAEQEAMELASRKKAERKAAEKAEREAMELANRRKAEREAKEKATARSTVPQVVTKQSQPFLRWSAIGVIVLCVLGIGVWGISSYLSSVGLIGPAPTDASVVTQPSITEAPFSSAEADTVTGPPFLGEIVESTDCSYGGEFKSIEAVDTYTVKFTLCYPDPAFLSKMAFIPFGIQDKDYLNETGGDSIKMSETPNGTGPYMVKEWIHGDHITFEANPNYWGDKPKIQTLVFRWSNESSARLLELQSGTVDGITWNYYDDYNNILTDSNLELYPYEIGNIFYIGLNNTVSPFDNEKVRQALAMAIDKRRIVDIYFPVGSQVAQQFVPSFFSPGYSTFGNGALWYDYDPETAYALLAEAGYPNGFETTISYRDVVRGYLPNANAVAQEIQAQLAIIGVTVNINKMESGSFLESVSAGQEGLYLLGWGMDYPDSTNFYDIHFADNAKRFGNEWPDLLEEIKAAAQLSDPSKRQEHYDKVNALIKEHVPMIPVAYGASANAMRSSVSNVIMGPLNENFEQMITDSGQLVWMQSFEPLALACGDEFDSDTLRACDQVYDTLVSYEFGGVTPVPALASEWQYNNDATEWIFTLRQGVSFHNGAALDANDVIATFAAQWDTANPNHKGNSGTFDYFFVFFGQFLNAP